MTTAKGLDNLLDVMKTMAATERLIGDFYRICAEKWEEDRSFWFHIADEEEQHARYIERMAGIITEKPERFEIGRPFSQAAAQTVMNGIKENMKRLEQGSISRERLLFITRDMEHSIMEKNYGEIVKTSDHEYLALIREIVEETARHRSSIDERIRAMKAGGTL